MFFMVKQKGRKPLFYVYYLPQHQIFVENFNKIKTTKCWLDVLLLFRDNSVESNFTNITFPTVMILFELNFFVSFLQQSTAK